MKLTLLAVLFLAVGCAALQPGTPGGDKVDRELTAGNNAVNAGAEMAKTARDINVPYAGLVYGGLVAVAGVLTSIVNARDRKHARDVAADVAKNTIPIEAKS